MEERITEILICPITQCIFRDPVLVTKDGHTYEREAITEWINRNHTSPFTREEITLADLAPNNIVRELVNEFQVTLTKCKYTFKLGEDIEHDRQPFLTTDGKKFYRAKWLRNSNGPPIVLLKLLGAQTKREASFYERLTRHRHIVHTYGLVETQQHNSEDTVDEYVSLLQEEASEGDLSGFLVDHPQNDPNIFYSDRLLNLIFLQITDAMMFLSSKGITHGDLACRNVLVFCFDEQQPEKTLVKITDFGISRGNPNYTEPLMNTMKSTVPIRSAAPEILLNVDDPLADLFSEKTDIFAFGVLMWEVYSNGRSPWSELKRTAHIKEKVIKGERLSRPRNCKSDAQWTLILKCMSQDPNDRPTFKELSDELKRFLDQSNILNTDENSLTSRQNSLLVEKPTQEIAGALEPSSRESQLINTEWISDKASGRPSLVSKTSVKQLRDHFELMGITEKSTPKETTPKKLVNTKSEEQIQKFAPPPPPRPRKLSDVESSGITIKTESRPPQDDLIKLIKWH